ncbi:TadE/TadG family type IV pilus assembly protein [Brevundimonas staleyi]|uniref:TadE/TadG family type IV pilus assembly protein n=1 Tax=Brevundimonas staleyi TaxID=74326 RepID=A0ABW0FSM4_9CAUL
MSRRRAPGFFQRFGGDLSGSSAVEFAIIAPVIVLIYFGLAEFCQAYMAQRRMGHATSQVADIVAQYQTVNATLVDNTFALGGIVLAPFSDSTLSLRVTSITRGTDGVARVVWSRGNGTLGKRAGVVTVPAGLIANGENIIMSEGTYAYTSPLGQVLPGTRTFSHTYWLRPRLVNAIPCNDC